MQLVSQEVQGHADIGGDEAPLVAAVSIGLEALSFRMKGAWEQLQRSVSEISHQKITDLDLRDPSSQDPPRTFHAVRPKVVQSCQSIR